MGSQETGISRTVSDKRPFNLLQYFMQWEWMLLGVLIIINIINMLLSSNYLNMSNFFDSMIVYMDKAIMVFPMAMVMIMADLDISIASTMALSSVVMGMAYRAGVPILIAICISLLTGIICGLFNGILIVKFKELSSVIITLTNMIFFRGIALMLLENNAITKFPSQFSYLAYGKIGPFPFILLFFLMEFLVFGLIMNRTRFGRYIYAIGNNTTASYFMGIRVNRIKIIIFTISGLFAAIAGVFLTSKLASTRATVADGYHMDVLAMVVLGGISVNGGTGKMLGVFFSVFIISLMRYGLGLVNVSSQDMMVIIGALLIITVALPNLKEFISNKRQKV